MSADLLPADFPGMATSEAGGWGADGTYTGPLYPQVHDPGDGTRRVVYNDAQEAVCAVQQYWGEPYPRMRDRGEGRYELFLHPGSVRQGTLKATGTVINAGNIAMMPAGCRPNPHPTIGEGDTPPPEFDPRDPCSMNAPTFGGDVVETVDPLTGEVHTDIFGAPEGCHSAYLWEDGRPLERDEYPFQGHACFYQNGVQGPCPSDPGYGSQAPGEGVYAKGTVAVPVAPWSDPESRWYGHRVMGRGLPAWQTPGEPTGQPTGPAQPPTGPDGTPGPYEPPCRACDSPELVAGVVMCVPQAGCTGPQPAVPECWIGLDPAPPHGDLYDSDCLFPDDGNGGNGGGGAGGGGGPSTSPGPAPISLPRWWPAAAIGVLLVMGER